MSGTVANNLERSSGTIGAAGSGITVDSGDPAIDSNPAGGVGTVWSNSTSGETYVCTDATAGSNVWKNVGDGTGDIEPWSYPGLTYGYVHGGGSPSNTANIEKFNMASDGDGASVGVLTVARASLSHGNVSEGSGYTAGGSGDSNVIDKYSYTSDSDSSDIGNLTVGRGTPAGTASTENCYTAGGSSGPPSVNVIDKWSVSSDGDASDVGDLTTNSYGDGAGCSSLTYGYMVSGTHLQDRIEKWSHVSDANATDVADPATPRNHTAGSHV